MSIPSVAVELTPKQRAEERKRQQADARAEEMKSAASGAKANYDQARWARQQNTFNHMMSNPHAAAQNFDHREQEAFNVPVGGNNNDNRPAAQQAAAADVG